MIRVCPKRDAACPHGMSCPYTVDRYECAPEDRPMTTLPAPLRVGSQTFEAGSPLSDVQDAIDGVMAVNADWAKWAARSSLRWHSYDDVPEPGRKIVALYLDGSGARLFFVHDGGLIDAEGDDMGELGDHEFWNWAYLPRGFTLWCETRSEDPLKFPAEPAQALLPVSSEGGE